MRIIEGNWIIIIMRSQDGERNSHWKFVQNSTVFPRARTLYLNISWKKMFVDVTRSVTTKAQELFIQLKPLLRLRSSELTNVR